MNIVTSDVSIKFKYSNARSSFCDFDLASIYFFTS